MKRSLTPLFLAASLLAAALLAACQPAVPAASAQSPVGIVQSYYDAVNAKDIDAAMAFIATDAVFINPTGTYEGADAIRASLEGLAADDLGFKLSNFRHKDGRVVYDYEVLIGGETIETGTDGLTIVKNGLIVFDGTESSEP